MRAVLVVCILLAALIGFVAGWTLRPIVAPPDPMPPAAPRTKSGDRPDPPPEGLPPSAGSPADEPVAPEVQARTAEEWLALINGSADDRAAAGVVAKVLALGAGRSREVLLAIFARIENPSRRRTCLVAMTRDLSHPYTLRFLDLGMGDADPEVRDQAADRATSFTFQDFKEKPDDWADWYATQKGRTIAAVFESELVAYFDRLQSLGNEALVVNFHHRPWRKIRQVQRLKPKLQRAYRASAAPALVRHWLSSPETLDQIRTGALEWVQAIGVDRSFLEDWIIPVIRRPQGHTASFFDRCCSLLGSAKAEWAFDDLVDAYAKVPKTGYWWSISIALAEIGDKRAIPHMIAVIAADGEYDSVYGVGYFGLGKLTGVAYDKKHDGAWWLDWWGRNREHLPENIRTLSIPKLAPRAVEKK